MALKFASEQPEGTKNFIEKVAIVGVSYCLIFLSLYFNVTAWADVRDRRAVKSANFSQKSYSKLEIIKSPQLPV